MGEGKRQKSYGLDVARAAAVTLVLSVHFFLNNGFYYAPVAGKSALVSCVVRMLCMTCVPLFLLLTGYLCVERRWEKGYYRKLLPILFTYLLASVVCVAFRMSCLGERYPLRTVLRGFTDYSAAPYAWYIEMYIGLFLLSPFFNAAWSNLDERGQKALLLTLLGLTALPTVTNQVEPVLPDWWITIYPLTFYAAGAWLRKHPIRIKSRRLLLCWLGLAALMGLKGYVNSGGGTYIWMLEDNWNSLTLLVQTVCLFSCLVRCTGEHTPAPVRWCVGRVARLSLGIYLISYVADQLIYPVLNRLVPEVNRRIWWMPVVLPAVLVCSCVMAQPIDWAAGALMKLVPAKKQTAQES